MSNNKVSSSDSIKEAFKEDLRPKYIMDYLVRDKVFSVPEKNDILSVKSSREQVEKLFEILLKKSSKEYNNFIKVLERGDETGVNYPWLAEKLHDTDYYNFKMKPKANLNEHVDKLLRNGGVPFQKNRILFRKKKVLEVREQLRWASVQKRHWVILHGTTGTGKTVLAIEAVRNNEIIEKYFPDGVYWISVGNVKDYSALGIRIKKLFKLLNCEEKYISCETQSDFTETLQKVVCSKKMLVILDDVWDNKSVDVIKLFNIGCPILVTTKFNQICRNYTDWCSKIPCGNNFEISECMELLALYVNCGTEELPPEVDSICKKCKRSPILVSRIGSKMAQHGNNITRWRHMKDLLEKDGQSAIRKRHSSGDELREIKEIIRLLEPYEEYNDYYLDFAIFPEDVFVPAEVLAVLWNKNVFDVEDIMYNFIGASLVELEMDPDRNYSYAIHDLYLDILREICNNEEERHLKLVNNYLKTCKTADGTYDFSLLKDDNYIHYYIGYHIDHIGEGGLLDGIEIDDIFFDLKFIEKKLNLDPRDLLVDYQNYVHKFKKKNLLMEYEAFARKYAHIIYANPDSDIIQLALFEPTNSVIYEKALSLASKSSDKSYFEWCNQEESISHIPNLNAKPSFVENLRHAAISHDGLLIACANDKNKISVFTVSTGEEFCQLTGHTSSINYCVFNAGRSKLLTASDDMTVKIFDIPVLPLGIKPKRKTGSAPLTNVDSSYTPDLSVTTFNQHFSKAKCCNFSPNEDLVVSSDVNGFVHIWQSYTADPKFHVHHKVKYNDQNFRIYSVNNCYFNSDGTLFGSVAYDSVRIWCAKTGNVIKEFLHNDMIVKGFCFTMDNCVISIADKRFYKDGKLLIECKKNLVLTSCCISPDGNYLACGTSENSVLIYLANTCNLISKLKGHRSDVLNVMFTEDSQKLLSSSEDGYIVHYMSYVSNTSMVSSEGNLSVKQNFNDLILASSNYFNCIEIRMGCEGKLYHKIDCDDSDITACSILDDCTEVVYGTHSGDVKVFNIQSKTVKALKKHDDQINYITHAKNLFFTCSEDKTLRIWSGESYIKLKGHTDSVLMCVPFRSRDQLLSCSKDGTLRVWSWDSNNNTGKAIVITEGHGNQDVRYCDISYNEKYLASASADRTVKIWHAENGNLYRILSFESEVKCCRFSPTVQVLIAGCDSGEIKRWQLGPRTECKDLCFHSSCVNAIHFDKTGSQYLSVASDIKIWSIYKTEPQTILLPTSLIGGTCSHIWASDNFDIFVVIHASVLYILKRIQNTQRIHTNGSKY